MYSLNISRQAVKDIANLPGNYPPLVSEHINALAQNPRPPGVKKLRGGLGYRLRVGDYRIVYEINDQAQSIIVYRVQHRRDVYR